MRFSFQPKAVSVCLFTFSNDNETTNNMTNARFISLCKAGKIEALTDRTVNGYQEIRWIATGKRVMICVKK